MILLTEHARMDTQIEHLKERVQEFREENQEVQRILREISSLLGVLNTQVDHLKGEISLKQSSELAETEHKILLNQIFTLNDRADSIEDDRKWIVRSVLGAYLLILFNIATKGAI